MRFMFIVLNFKLFASVPFSSWVASILYGLPLDFSIAGYLTIPCILMNICSLWINAKWKLIQRYYLVAASSILLLLHAINAILYGYWRFPLDTTPFYYFFSSPKEALASADIWDYAFIAIVSCVLFFLIYQFQHKRIGERTIYKERRWYQLMLHILFALILIIPIRGGISVSTMNTGHAYFSNNELLNHAAVNPVLSLLESIAKQKDFASQYRFMEGHKAKELFAQLTSTHSNDTLRILRTARPDIYIIIMESFSRILMHTDATPHLNQLANDGVFFRNFYANSFRTDRGIVSILSGFPGQPTMSIMKYPEKSRHLPSIARTLAHVGYKTTYYYGGDADFCNQRSYLVSQGYEKIYSDTDFPISHRLSKWGVPDGPLFDFVQHDIQNTKSSSPQFRVIQTSSSHEPFDVPEKILTDKRLNAFAYADRHIGQFVQWLKNSNKWQNSLILLVADHWGVWPENMPNHSLERFQIPLILTGGVVQSPMQVDTYASQQDIAATLLGQLGIAHQDFLFSKDILQQKNVHFAFFTMPDFFGMATENGAVMYDNTSARVVFTQGDATSTLLTQGQAYLQSLYDYIGNLSSNNFPSCN